MPLDDRWANKNTHKKKPSLAYQMLISFGKQQDIIGSCGYEC